MDSIVIRGYAPQDLPALQSIWNEVVEDGVAFPQDVPLDETQAENFFASQSFTAVAQLADGTIGGLYILHPNNVGRCGHIANASYAVAGALRGRRIGEKLVSHSLEQARKLGFRILQFNAVVASNQHALSLYRKLGFTPLGLIPGGFRLKDGRYEDIIPHYKLL